MKSDSFYRYTLPDLRRIFSEQGLPPSGPELLYYWHHKMRRSSPCVDDLAKVSREFVARHFDFDLPEIASVKESADKTVKFLFRLGDGNTVETVLIPFNGKYSICLSSQVGCGMNCSFCFTGTQGLKRHLRAEEIVGQFIVAKNWLVATRPDDCRLLNIVFMGQGEPLHNFDEVKTACEIFLERRGLGLAPHKITISTAGHLPGLERWKAEMPPVNIAVSFHSPFKHKRDELIPINRRWPLEEVMRLAEAIPQGKLRFVTYEYLLLEGFNDALEDAVATGELLRGRNVFVSLIPFNPYPGAKYQRPSPEKVEWFKSVLDQFGVQTIVRKTKGDEILAACGQLKSMVRARGSL